MANLLFDLDGTLADSSQGIKNAFAYTFSNMGEEVPDDAILSSFIGPPLETSLGDSFVTPDKTEQAIKLFRQFYKETGVYQAKLYDGIKEMLEELAKSHQLFVTTSKNQPMAEQMLDDFGITHYFKAIYGATPERFDKEDVIQACLADHNLSKQDSFIIGDTKYDMIGGTKAGINCVGVIWGFGSQDDLLNNGASKLAHAPNELNSMF